MEVWLDEEWLKGFYRALFSIYRDTDYPITFGINEGMVNVCIERPLTGIYDLIPFPHLLHKASVLLHTIINFHPFADGNKRVALLATFYFLYWNGYELIIPEDADKFTIEIAKGQHNLNDTLSWLVRHCRRNFLSILTNLFCSICITLWYGIPQARPFIRGLFPLLLPLYPFMWFMDIIQRKKKKTEGHEVKLKKEKL